MRITLRTPAKVNLGLWLKGLRPDGYHEIETILIPIGLWDELELETGSEGIEVHCRHPQAPSEKANLVYKAAQIFYRRAGLAPGVKIKLKKGIPIGAGLGGGSSDAAATLMGLNLAYDRLLPADALFEMAAQLGSDVPFFLLGQAGYARGRGEVLKPIKGIDAWIVLHIPRFSIETRWAYSRVSGLTEEEPRSILLKERVEAGDMMGLKDLVHNSFERFLFDLYPRLYWIKERFMMEEGAWVASISGTGPAIYALVKEEAYKQFTRRMKGLGIEVVSTRTLKGWGVV